MEIIKKYFSNIELGEIKKYKNMATVALSGVNFKKIDYLTLTEAMNKNTVKITEVDESGSVNELKITNNSNKPILILDGEEVKGAKQNRILNTSILIPENFVGIIPVSCTEQGRWNYESSEFEVSNHIASKDVRGAKSASVSRSLKHNNTFSSNQGEVWSNIEKSINEYRNISEDYENEEKFSTSALEDVFISQEDELEDYLKSFVKTENQSGIAVFIDNELAGIELLSNSEKYGKYHEKIIESYALDASLSNKSFKKEKIDFLKQLNLFLEEIPTIIPLENDSIGYGTDCRIVNKDIAGSLLIHENEIIHGAFFKKKENTIYQEDDIEVNIASPSRRASFFD